MKSLKSSALAWIVAIVSILVGLIQSKVIAVNLGAYGVGVFGQCLAFLAFVNQPISNGLSNATVRFIALNNSLGNYRDVKLFAGVARALTLGLSIIIMVLAVASSRFLAQQVLGEAALFPIIIIAAVSVPAISFAITAQSLLQAFGRTLFWALSTIIPLLLGAVLMIVLVNALGMNGAVLQLGMVGVMTGVVATVLYRRFCGQEGEAFLRLDRRIAVQLVSFGGALIFTSLARTGIQLIARSVLVQEIGLEAAGNFQVVSSISQQYFSVIFTMSVYWTPHLSSVIEFPQMVEELNRYLRLSLAVVTPVLVAIVLLREPLVRLIYTDEFMGASMLLPLQVLGDFARLVWWTVGSSLLPLAQMKAFVSINIGLDIVYLVFFRTLISGFGLAGALLAHLVAYSLVVVALLIFQRQAIGFGFTTPNVRLLSGSFVLLLLSIAMSMFLPFAVALCMSLGGLALWALVSSTQEERALARNPRAFVRAFLSS